MKSNQLVFIMKVVIGVFVVCFLLGTSYMASRLSSFQLKSFADGKNIKHPFRSEFIQILIRTEKDRLIGAVALANSIVSNTRNPVHFYFITDQESSLELHSWIENSKLSYISYEIKIVEPKNFNFTVSQYKDETWLDYALIYIPILFPQANDRLIVLSDDIIVQGDIAELNNVTIEKNHFGALSSNCDTLSRIVDKNQNKYLHYFNLKSPELKYKNINGSTCVFDMGVMVLNMTLWKEKDVTKQLLQWIKRNKKENLFHINSFLSPFLLVFYDKMSSLTSSWHVRHLGATVGSRYSRNFLEKANLLHWDGHFKPWKHKLPYLDLWKRYSILKPELKT